MFSYKLILLWFLPLCLSELGNVTFNNVTFRGYEESKEKFSKTIQHSNNLKDFLPLSKFDKIEFKDQNIPVLYEDSLTLRSLDKLVFKNCGIYEIQPGALKGFRYIGQLSLTENKIVEIKAGVFNNLSIFSIHLSDNLISTIDSNAFDDMPDLQSVFLVNNSIARWDINWFKNTPSLFIVSMKNNSITTLPNYAFKNLVGTRRFGFVITIILSYNRIKTIESKAFSNLTEKYSFYLDNNQLEEWDEDLLENVKVADLWLNSNNIRCFEGDLKKILKGQIVVLYSNPFNCSCIDKINEWADKNFKGRLLLPLFGCSLDELLRHRRYAENTG